MTHDEMTRDEMTHDEMIGEEIARSRKTYVINIWDITL
jgi:hypothetical protein